MDPRKYFVLSNCGWNQNHDTSSYHIKNQTQYHRTSTPYHTILNPAVVVVQHPFQLCQQRSHFYYLYTCDLLARTVCGNEKDVLPSFVNVKALLFSIQYGHASFSCVLQLETILYTGKSLIVHIKVVFIWKFCFLDTSYVKAIKWPQLFQGINQ